MNARNSLLLATPHAHSAITNQMADELGNWRPERNRFSRSYFSAYHSHIPKASPEEDYDDRNALYAMQVDQHVLYTICIRLPRQAI